MSNDESINSISRLSVKEIKDLYMDQPQVPTDSILAQLKGDSRKGVQKIFKTISKRIEQERLENIRINKLLTFERGLRDAGLTRIAGVDEAGMGPLAGPVVAAAVILPADTVIPGIDDSKRLSEKQREALAEKIMLAAVCTGIGLAEIEEIASLNIYHAGLLAMRRAVNALSISPEHILVDARTIPGITTAQSAFKEGDAHHYHIAAASILAKTHRDGLMRQLDQLYPGYGFSQHKGYGTSQHCAAIRELGPCPAHRTSFSVFNEM